MKRASLTSAIFAIASLLSFQLAAAEEDFTSDSISKIAHGVFCSGATIRFEEAPETVAGVINIIEGTPQLVRPGSIVPAAKDVSFGVRSTAANGLILENVMVHVTHPPMGENGATIQSYVTNIGALNGSHTIYSFDFDYELLPGTWTISAIHFGELLFRRSFEVVDPTTVPELAVPCGYEDLIG